MADVSSELINAVQWGNLEKATRLINTYGVFYSKEWSEGYVLLRDALKEGHTEIAKLLLTQTSKVNSKSTVNRNVDTPLHFAVKMADLEIIKTLLDKGARIDAKDSREKTPFFYAIQKMKTEIIELLLKYGADVNARGEGYCLLHEAVQAGNLQAVRELIIHGAFVNCRVTSKWSNGYTPLHLAAERGNKECVTLLLSKRADLNASDANGLTPLHIAAEKGKEEIVELFLNKGVDVDVVGTGGHSTPLHSAIKSGQTKVVILLLEKGAKVDKKDKDGRTVLYLSVENGNLWNVEHVLQHYPDVNCQSNRSSLTIAAIGRKEQIVKALLDYGLTVEQKEANNSELFLTSIEKGFVEIVELLLKYGADVNTTNPKECTLCSWYLLEYSAKLEHHSYCKALTPLHRAMVNKQEQIANLLIKYGADVNSKDQAGKPLIYHAIMNTDTKMFKLLLNKGADLKEILKPELLNYVIKKKCLDIVRILLENDVSVTHSDSNGITSLHFTAIDEGLFFTNKNQSSDVNGEIAKLLLAKGAKADAQTKTGITTLHAAVKNGYTKVVEALLEHNANVNLVANNSTTPLHLSALRRDKDIITMLLSKGADINVKQNDGGTALNFATKKGHAELVKHISVLQDDKTITTLLLSKGADVNAKHDNGSTALHIATKNGHGEFVKELLEYGANVSSKTKIGATPLHLSALRGNKDIITILLSKGADINAKQDDGNTALHIATKNGHGEFVKELLEYGANVNSKNKNGATPLHISVLWGDKAITLLLLGKGAHVNAKQDDGNTALHIHIATKNGHGEFVKELLEYGANVNSKSKNGATPLHISVLRGDKAITLLLLGKGAHVNAKQDDGNTALHIATENGQEELVKELLEYGANVNSKSKNGVAPLHLSFKNGNTDIIKTLLEFGADINTVDDDECSALGYSLDLFLDENKSSDYEIERFYDYYDYLCEEITNIKKRHILQMKTAGLYVSKQNLLLIGNLDDMTAFKDECEKELAFMKTEKIGSTDISFYEILRKGSSSLTICLMNEDVVRVLKAKEYSPKFPIYAKMIENRFKKGMEWKEAYAVFYYHFTNPELPYECVEKIFSFLSDEDFDTFIDAGVVQHL